MRHILLGFVSAFSFAAAAPAFAQDKLASHYAGKTVRIVVGYPSGSGFDVYARTVSRYMGKHIPGKPNVIVQNMPGAGGLTSVAYMANVAPRDGLTLALINPVNSTEPLLNPEVARFDSTKFRWLGSVNKDVQTCVFWTQKAKSIDDMRNVELVLGATGPSSGSALDAKALQACSDSSSRWSWDIRASQTSASPQRRRSRRPLRNAACADQDRHLGGLHERAH